MVRKGPFGSGGNRKRIWLPGAVPDLREDRSQVTGVQRVRGWRCGAGSGCGQGEQPEGGVLDWEWRDEDAQGGRVAEA